MLDEMEARTPTTNLSDEAATSTASWIVHSPPEVSETVSPSLAELVSDVGVLRTRSRLISSDISETSEGVARLHRNVRDGRLAQEARRVAMGSPVSFLDGLSDRGFSWRDIARMVGVSVPAVKKWRRGEAISGDNRYRLAELVALCEILEDEVVIEDLATWFEMPLLRGAAVTPIDLVVAGRLDLVQEHAHENEAPADLLDDFDPEWRSRDTGDFEVVVASDGVMSIRAKVPDD